MTYQSALDLIMRNGKVSETDADRVFQAYRLNTLIKYNAHDGYSAVHGAIFDHAVIHQVLEHHV